MLTRPMESKRATPRAPGRIGDSFDVMGANANKGGTSYVRPPFAALRTSKGEGPDSRVVEPSVEVHGLNQARVRARSSGKGRTWSRAWQMRPHDG